MEAVILRGVPPEGYGSGYGYGYGDGSGYGDGDGSGDGDGYGNSDGYGDGSGDGDGSGNSDGSGSGYGSGYGYGYGSGCGDGDAYGYGYGYGYGDGEAGKAYRVAAIDAYASLLPSHAQARLIALRTEGATIAYWNSDADGRACNGGSGKPVTAGMVQEVAGPLSLCSAQALHATYFPHKWKGERTWLVALIGEVTDNGDGEKFGALKREIIGECLSP